MNATEIRALIESRMEDTRVRDIIRAFFTKYKGKTWTRVYRDKLAAELGLGTPNNGERSADDLLQREDEFTGIEIMTRSYLNSGGRKGWRFTVAKDGWQKPIDNIMWGGWQKPIDKIMCPEKLMEWNPAHYRGVDERNAKRREALADPLDAACGYTAACLEDYKRARAALVACRERVEPDWHEILEKAGVKL